MSRTHFWRERFQKCTERPESCIAERVNAKRAWLRAIERLEISRETLTFFRPSTRTRHGFEAARDPHTSVDLELLFIMLSQAAEMALTRTVPSKDQDSR